MFDLKTDIRYLKGVGEKRAISFSKVGIHTTEDLLYYFPRDWRDFSKTKKISDIKVGEEATVRAKLVDVRTKYTRKRGFTITEALFSDGTGDIKAVWFNQPYISSVLKKGDDLYLAGKIEDDKGFSMKNPVYEKLGAEEAKHLGRIVPIYREIGNISSRMIRYIIKPVLDDFEVAEFLPADITERLKLPDIKKALMQIHFPENIKEKDGARRRLTFDEVFIPQLLNQMVRRELKGEKAFSQKNAAKILRTISGQLPFKLTNSQLKALSEISKDMKNNFPMNRLLEGDVGSGKTIVAFLSLVLAAKNRYQGALMVPTEVLAWEHYENLNKITDLFDIKTALVTGSTKKNEKETIYKDLKKGKISIIVGTHALLSENIVFKDLALAVIDEQHRFGVSQRKILRQKNQNIMPHLLSMTATPIPRTFALTVYGDLDISILKDMPRGRRETKTYLVPQKKKADAYKFIKEKIKKGDKALVICPTISLSEKLSAAAVEEEFEKLKKGPFKGEKIDMLHGKMKTIEKQKKIEDFKRGKIKIMVSTTVIEVGLNIKNLNIMMIENAERFGLAQLHQLRGRIGRGGEESFFLMFTQSKNLDTLHRLKEMTKIEDGFELAEFDLTLRGEGDVFGTRQSGMPKLRLASVSDYDLIEEAHKEAIKTIIKDPRLAEHKLLKDKVGDIYKGVHAE